MKTVLELLEASVARFPEKLAYADERKAVSFRETEESAKRLGSFLAPILAGAAHGGDARLPVAVFMEKSVEAVLSFLGILYAGGFYCPLDVSMPEARIRTILSELRPAAILAREKDKEKLAGLCEGLSRDLADLPAAGGSSGGSGSHGTDGEGACVQAEIVWYEEALRCPVRQERLQGIRQRAMETDPLYVLYTSGSTGVPKGVLLSHRVILRNMDWLERHYAFSEEDVLGNQVPFYFDVSDHDIYAVLKFGASMHIIPQTLFAFPVRLVQFLNEHRVTAIFWVPFALSMVANLDAFKAGLPRYLRYVFFAGEVMPVKQLRYWQQYLPDLKYANMYGPTETYVCTYYDVDRDFGEEEALPIGFPLDYARALVLDAEGRLVEPGTEGRQGELCILGDTLALGYYRNPARTAERFMQNPLCTGWPERMYRTGDLVRYNARGELLYLGREDAQVKHMGYRIELGEIEAAGHAVAGIDECACVYDASKRRIAFYYAGQEYGRKELLGLLAERVPKYMLPGRIVRMERLPRNLNGKVDRQALL